MRLAEKVAIVTGAAVGLGRGGSVCPRRSVVAADTKWTHKVEGTIVPGLLHLEESLCNSTCPHSGSGALSHWRVRIAPSVLSCSLSLSEWLFTL